MRGLGRYFRLYSAFARFSLANEMAFRGNFLLKLLVEILWLGILLIFYRTLYAKTDAIAGWDENQFLFFVGCYYAMEGIVETLFLSNCIEFAELVRTGQLDQYLLKPIDEQFLVSFRWVDWSTAPKLFIGGWLMLQALLSLGWAFDPWRAAAFPVLFVSGVVLSYSFLLMLCSTSVWMVRNSSMMELWWLFTTLMRYPRDIYSTTWATPIRLVFTFVLPALLVISVPAEAMVKAFDPLVALGMAVAAGVMFWISRAFFRHALRSYRSASS